MPRAMFSRIALLAVAPEDVGQLVGRQRVDQVGGRDRRLGVHAHVERRVVGVAEAALAPVELHGRDAEVHVDDVHRGVVHLGQHIGEVAVVELGGAGRGARDVAEVLGHAGVAVAGDQRAVGAERARPRPRHARRRRRWQSKAVSPSAGFRRSTSSSSSTGVWASAISYSRKLQARLR